MRSIHLGKIDLMPAKIDVEIKDVEYINGEVILTSNIGDKIARCVIMKVGTDIIWYS